MNNVGAGRCLSPTRKIRQALALPNQEDSADA